jgi:hypothetical protein
MIIPNGVIFKKIIPKKKRVLILGVSEEPSGFPSKMPTFGNNIFSYTEFDYFENMIWYKGLDNLGSYAMFNPVDGELKIYNGNDTLKDEFLLSS